MNKPERVPQEVIDAVTNWVGEDKAPEILASLRWNSLDNYYWIERHGMHIGIELDGYIHS